MQEGCVNWQCWHLLPYPQPLAPGPDRGKANAIITAATCPEALRCPLVPARDDAGSRLQSHVLTRKASHGSLSTAQIQPEPFSSLPAWHLSQAASHSLLGAPLPVLVGPCSRAVLHLQLALAYNTRNASPCVAALRAHPHPSQTVLKGIQGVLHQLRARGSCCPRLSSRQSPVHKAAPHQGPRAAPGVEGDVAREGPKSGAKSCLSACPTEPGWQWALGAVVEVHQGDLDGLLDGRLSGSCWKPRGCMSSTNAPASSARSLQGLRSTGLALYWPGASSRSARGLGTVPLLKQPLPWLPTGSSLQPGRGLRSPPLTPWRLALPGRAEAGVPTSSSCSPRHSSHSQINHHP